MGMFSKILEAASGSTILLVRLSSINESLLDIHVQLPTLREGKAIYALFGTSGDYEHQLENDIIDKYCLVDIEKEWLLSHAPAGLVSSIARILIAYAYPSDLNATNMLIGVNRFELSKDPYLQMSALASMIGFDVGQVDKLDVYQLMSKLASLEPRLVGLGLLDENGFNVTEQVEGGVEETKEKPLIPKHLTDFGNNSKLLHDLGMG